MTNVQFRYGGKKGKKQSLRVSNDLVIVRTHGQKSLRESQVSPKCHQTLQDFTSVFRIPEVGIEVLRSTTRKEVRAARDRARIALRKEDPVRFAGRGLCTPKGRPVLYTENLFVQFDEDLSASKCKKLLKEHGFKPRRELEYARNAWFASAEEGTGHKVFGMAAKLLALPEVELCHPELVQEIVHKAAFRDQWHLKRTSIGGNTIDQHANVEVAWPLSEGEGVTIAVIDNGCDMAHEEFAGAGKIVSPRDVTNDTNDPSPGSRDKHGTACCGVACANGTHGASGVAPKAKLMPIRLASGLGSQAEADAFVWAADHGADVISCSWGPVDGDWWDPDDPQHNEVVPLPDSTRLAIDYAITQGRAGKGCVITWAAGNGNEPVDNDGYASYDKVVAVGASNDQGKRAEYSDVGDALWCVFPSSNGGPSLTPGIWTTDNSGAAGYNAGSTSDGDAAGNYTNSFGGTSSACPGAAGVAALVIARNPDLRWDEVKDILRRCARQIDTSGGDYDAGGHSKQYGYGRLDAKKAVELAAPAAPTYTAVHKALQAVPIKDLTTHGIQVVVGDAKPLTNIKVHVDLEHTWIGDLVVEVVPPSGTGVTQVVLHDREGGGSQNLRRVYDTASTPGLASLIGKSPQGAWKLNVSDRAKRDVGQIVSFGVELGL